MIIRVAKKAFFLYFLYFNVVFIASTENAEDIPGGKISLSVPQLSEEENKSQHMPNHLRCDACLAVAHQIHAAFTKVEEKKPSIKESEMIDILENTCNDAFHNYGVKQVNNINRLSGPGLESEHIMGMTQMGGRWPHRLQEMCHYYIGEAGEYDIYEEFIKGKENLTKFLCYGKGIYSHCTVLKPAVKTEL